MPLGTGVTSLDLRRRLRQLPPDVYLLTGEAGVVMSHKATEYSRAGHAEHLWIFWDSDLPYRSSIVSTVQPASLSAVRHLQAGWWCRVARRAVGRGGEPAGEGGDEVAEFIWPLDDERPVEGGQ
jgi:hypothetical protein